MTARVSISVNVTDIRSDEDRQDAYTRWIHGINSRPVIVHKTACTRKWYPHGVLTLSAVVEVAGVPEAEALLREAAGALGKPTDTYRLS